jgi:hypothetical protein
MSNKTIGVLWKHPISKDKNFETNKYSDKSIVLFESLLREIKDTDNFLSNNERMKEWKNERMKEWKNEKTSKIFILWTKWLLNICCNLFDIFWVKTKWLLILFEDFLFFMNHFWEKHNSSIHLCTIMRYIMHCCILILQRTMKELYEIWKDKKQTHQNICSLWITFERNKKIMNFSLNKNQIFIRIMIVFTKWLFNSLQRIIVLYESLSRETKDNQKINYHIDSFFNKH